MFPPQAALFSALGVPVALDPHHAYHYQKQPHRYEALEPLVNLCAEDFCLPGRDLPQCRDCYRNGVEGLSGCKHCPRHIADVDRE